MELLETQYILAGDDGALKIAFALVIFGATAWWRGFKSMKLHHAIRNIPTSKIKFGAVGSNVEISGRIIDHRGYPRISPISKSSCHFFELELQKYIRTRKSGYWKKVDEYLSDNFCYITDSSKGVALVHFANAEFHFKDSHKTKNSFIKDLLANGNDYRLGSFFYNFPDAFPLHADEWGNSSIMGPEYRIIERPFSIGEPIYVIGEAHAINKNDFIFQGLEEKVKTRDLQSKSNSYFKSYAGKVLRKLKKDKQLYLKMFDANLDGMIDQEEYKVAVNHANHEAFKLKNFGLDQMKMNVQDLLQRSILSFYKKTPESLFVISNMHEENFKRKTGFKAWLSVIGGPFMILMGVVVFLWKIGYLG